MCKFCSNGVIASLFTQNGSDAQYNYCTCTVRVQYTRYIYTWLNYDGGGILGRVANAQKQLGEAQQNLAKEANWQLLCCDSC